MVRVASKPSPRKLAGSRAPRRWAWWWLAPAVVFLSALWLAADWWIGVPEGVAATYVGRSSCIECHQQQGHLHAGSHHDLAMDRATPETVLGDFNNQQLEHHGTTSRMFRRGDKYLIETEGPDGKPGEFEIKYVFGVTPLQQYMVEFDRPADMPEEEIARLQVLRVSWDTERQQWFHLDPPDVKQRLDPGDDLHWTGIAQRWNTMCADCHSTNLQKNFDQDTGIYHTTFSEIDVSCEACHGPGSHHVALARQHSPFWDRKQGYALARIKGQPAVAEIESCAPCHSRRSTIHGGYSAGCNFQDFYASETLSETSYHADGQILDEVYEYGSFLQSKMYHKQVRCSDCHDPHSAKLKFQGNQVCTSCHQHPAGKYDTPAHHNHKMGSEGAQCVACHMPATTYMDVDSRRDHSFRIPRPNVSVQLGTPNACTGCHVRDAKIPGDQWPKPLTSRRGLEYADWLRAAREGNRAVQAELARIDAWAEESLHKWHPQGLKRDPHFAPALAAARRQSFDALNLLVEVLEDRAQPAIARATAARELAAYVHSGLAPQDAPLPALVAALSDRDPQVRAAAVDSLQQASPDMIARRLPGLLQDPIRLVRTRTALALSGVGGDSLLRREEPIWYREAIAELLAGAEFDSDRTGGHLLRGTIFESQQQLAEAEAEYRLAMRLEPRTVPPKSALAGLLDRMSQEKMQAAQQAARLQDTDEAERLARQADQHLAEMEQVKRDEWSFLERDAQMVPDNAALQLQLGLARYHQGWHKEAGAALEMAHRLAPRHPLFSYYLAVYYKDTDRIDEARALATGLLQQRPGDPQYKLLWDSLRGETPSP